MIKRKDAKTQRRKEEKEIILFLSLRLRAFAPLR